MIIDSNTKLPIENDFKIEAGPGAGKTQWLVNHINNVLKNSKRLGGTRKIACITYTNTAVETILSRLGVASSDRVEVSTIHSFLYTNIVKPCCSFLPAEYNLCVEKVKGHNDLTLNHKFMIEWLTNTKEFENLKPPNNKNQLLKLPVLKKALINWLETITCCIENSEASFKCDNSKAREYDKKNEKYAGIKKENLDILQRNLLEYKKLYWRNGKLDHDDVLFFSFVLIKNYQFILSILRAKFPYFYIDEFQDTNPIQTFILHEIRKLESCVGVIGDRAQSIYGFQGADVTQFTNFKIEETNQHIIKENHRSSNQIVTFLNNIRKDIEQEPCNNIEEMQVTLLVGKRCLAYTKAKAKCNGEELISLSRNNPTSNAMKREFEENSFDNKLLKNIDEHDSSGNRRYYISSFIEAIELAKNDKYKDAFKRIEWLYRKEKVPKKIAICNLALMLKKYDSYSSGTLMDFYDVLKKNVNYKLTGFRKGLAKKFYDETLYSELAICVNIVDDNSNHITIHKSKGAEYENVFLTDNREMLKFLLKPDLDNSEEHRIIYVAISRAKKKLFIHLEQLAEKYEKELKKMYQIDIERL